jgi:hypothetical protein
MLASAQSQSSATGILDSTALLQVTAHRSTHAHEAGHQVDIEEFEETE